MIDPNTGEIFDPLARCVANDPLFIRVIPYVEDELLEPPFLRAGAMNGAFNYNTDKASVASGLDFSGTESLTQQQFKEEADINTIVRRFGITGQMPENPRVPHYGDFTEVTDYQTALNAVRAAEEAFLALPAAVRAEFNNDPQLLLEAVEDPRNLDRLRELGLANPAKVEAPPAPASAPPEPIGQTAKAKPTAPPKTGQDQSST